MSHEALGKTNKGKATNPNVWFVGVTPRRNPELVVAVLWQNGQFSYYPARIGAKVVSAYVEKQRRIANNLVQPAKTAAPVEMSAVWTVPTQDSGSKSEPDRLQSGHFLVDKGQIVTTAPPESPKKLGAPSLRLPSVARVGNQQPHPAHLPVNQSTSGPQPAIPSSGKGL